MKFPLFILIKTNIKMEQSKMTAFINAIKHTYGFRKKDEIYFKNNHCQMESRLDKDDNQLKFYITFSWGGNAMLDEIMLLISALQMDFLITAKGDKVQIEIY